MDEFKFLKIFSAKIDFNLGELVVALLLGVLLIIFLEIIFLEIKVRRDENSDE